MNTNRIKFLNTYIDSLTSNEAKNIVNQFIKEKDNKYVVTPNTDIIVKMQDDNKLKKICDNADLILTDGQMLVKISKQLKNPIKERVCMTDFVWDICDLAVEKDYSIFMLGGKKEVLKKAVINVKRKYPTLKIAGAYSPELGFTDNAEMLEKTNMIIRNSHADILLVFLGCPKQEKFIYENRNTYQVPLSIPMGGCVDFIAGTVKRAPVWMQKSGFEWFYRFLQEPKRMFRRYFIEDIRIFTLYWKYRK